MEYKNNISPIPQYSLRETLLIWAAAAIPMWILGWGVYSFSVQVLAQLRRRYCASNSSLVV